jgi:nucleoid DNA-binding protein
MIDHYKLIDILSDRLRIEIKTAGNDLLEVLEQLHRSLKEQGEVELQGLGTFSLDGNQMSFKPDPSLEMDINFRYYGMQPIVLEASTIDASHPDADDHDIPETAVFVINEPEAPTVAVGDDELVEADSTITFDSPVLEEVPEPSTVANEPEQMLAPTSDQDLQLVEAEPVLPSSPKGSDLKTPPLKWKDPHTLPLEIRIDDAYARKGDRWRKIAGVAVFAFILLAGAGFSWQRGWLAGTGIPSFHEVFPDYVTRNDPGSITTDSPTINENRDAGSETQEQGQEQEQEQEQGQGLGQGLEQSAQIEVQEPENAPVTDGSFGLVGSWQQDMTGFYTIVSATMFTERVANEIFDEVVANNTRARLFRVRVQGEIAWELHLGQFETRELAREANLTLDRKFQSDVVRQYGQQ